MIALAPLGCGSREGSTTSDGSWVGTITTEGNATTVVNQSGSVWGGVATLIEEASIGVEAGPDEYMLGGVNSLVADDQRIYVADLQVPIVRSYNLDGSFVGDIGRQGQGPGEYERPVLLAVHPAGRLFVYDSPPRRVNVYTTAGHPLDTWPLSISRCCGWPIFALGPDELWVHVRQQVDEGGEVRFAVQSLGPEGLQGPVTWVPGLEHTRGRGQPVLEFEGRPFATELVWTAAPDGALLYGASDRYRFEVLRADGTRLIVERSWDPVPLSGAEKEWARRFAVAFEREYVDPAFTWDGADMAEHKPAYAWLGPTMSGEIWVLRAGPSERVRDCVDNPIEAGYRAALANRCWQESDYIVDVFGADGRYLGEVDLPPRVAASAGRTTFVDVPMVVARVEDGAGTVMVKRYRLVPPGDP